MGPIYMKELAMRIVSDVRSNNPNATPEDVVARLENLGFAEPGDGWRMVDRGDTDFGGVLSFRIRAAMWLKDEGQCATKWSAAVMMARSTCGRR